MAQHLIVRTSSRNDPIGVAARHRLGFDGYGMHSPLCQPPSPHHHLNAQISVKGSYGRRRQLSGIKADYVLVYFNDPDCEDCRRVKELLTLSPVVNDLLESGRLKLLSVCVEGKTPAWEKAEFPAGWIDGYDADQRLTREQVYDLKAMPTLYLLDAEKRVILKDASFEQVEERLS